MEQFEVREEKRFAVVMYGGVSLAIYMNGVAQELYRLVQSTSKQSAELKGSAVVYRNIAADLKRKFVVDILAGTSAGGINAVFLARALATGESFERLESVWVNTANMDELIDDRRGLGVGKSLLNGDKMYDELLAALEEMGEKNDGPELDEVDLFVTATDLEGRIVPVEIMGEQVNEREHRHVFHFRKALPMEDRKRINQFDRAYDHLIAFAARCTSSFPVAFVPVQLKTLVGTEESWRSFFEPLPSSGGRERNDDFGSRVFADGGYLDNKPFSYAIQTITERHSDAPVDRKLVYIEPSPEVLPTEGPLPKKRLAGAERKRVEPPDAIENAVKAFTLARYETIRQDLQILKRRNRLIERTNRILKGTEEDMASLGPKKQPPNVLDWQQMTLKEMVEAQGFGYGGYFRLRVARLTDELAEIICRHAGIDADSDGFLAVRDVVRVWRDDTYVYYQDGRRSRGKRNGRVLHYTKFVLDYDLRFHYRRLGFVLSIIDRLLLGGAESEKILTARGLEEKPDAGSVFRDELKRYRLLLSRRRRELLSLQHSLLEPAGEKPSELSEAVAALGFDRWTLVSQLRTASTDEGRRKKAADFLNEKKRFEAYQKVLGNVKEKVDAARDVMKKCKLDLGLPEEGPKAKWKNRAPAGWDKRVRWILQFYFRFFGHYDVVSYPLMEIMPLGEELDEAEIIRISPQNPAHLGGTKYGNFGAFFDKTWRNNDILRGRLDGASGIIRALFPDGEDAGKRKTLTDQAHEAIVQEWIDRYPEKEDFLAEVMTGASDRERQTTRSALSRLAWFGGATAVREEIRNILKGELGAKEFLRRFGNYQVNPSPSPEFVVRTITRLMHVTGKMLTGIAHKKGQGRLEKLSKVVAQAGAIGVSLVEVFLPGSWMELLSRRTLQVVMILGALMIAGSVYLTASGLGQLGSFVLAVGLLLELIRLAIAHFFRTGRVTRLLLLLLVVVGVAMLVNGIVYAPQAAKDLVAWLKRLPG